jgi:hypothetical protein
MTYRLLFVLGIPRQSSGFHQGFGDVVETVAGLKFNNQTLLSGPKLDHWPHRFFASLAERWSDAACP